MILYLCVFFSLFLSIPWHEQKLHFNTDSGPEKNTHLLLSHPTSTPQLLDWNCRKLKCFCPGLLLAFVQKRILLFLLMLSPLQDNQGPSFVSITQHIIPYSRVSNCQSITKMLNNQCVPCPKSTWGHL